jgi:glutamate racemase
MDNNKTTGILICNMNGTSKKEIHHLLPNEKQFTFADSKNAPYAKSKKK